MWRDISPWFWYAFHRWLMLSLFSWVHWPHVYILWRNVFFKSFDHLKIGLSFHYWVTRVLYLFWIFHCLDGLLGGTKVFNSDAVLLIFYFLLLLVLLLSHLGALSNPRSSIFTHKYSAKSFIILTPTLSSRFIWN